MKRYLVFANDCYYPSGGAGDFQKSFDTAEEAEEFAKWLISVDERGHDALDEYEVMDTEAPDSEYSDLKDEQGPCKMSPKGANQKGTP